MLGKVFKTTTPKNIAAYALGVAFSTGLFVFLAGLLKSDNQLPQKKVFEISVAPPPPPPMEEQMQEKIQDHPKPKPKIKPLIMDNPVQLPLDSIKVDLKVSINDMKDKIKLQRFSKTDALRNMSFETFALEQLDQTPRLLNSPSINYPRRLALQGIHSMTVRALVTINEKGKVEFMRFEPKPSSPLIEPVAKSFITRARFTPPTKDGKVVKAKFIWPITLSK